MDTGNFLNVIITVIGIIGAGAVALVCDMLKSNNERLREANLELSVRREEEQRRTELAIDQLRRLSPVAAERLLSAPAGLGTMTEPVRSLLGPAEPGSSSREPQTAVALAARPGTPISSAGAQPPPVLDPGTTMAEARRLARDFFSTVGIRDPRIGSQELPQPEQAAFAPRTPAAEPEYTPAAEPAASVGQEPVRPPRKNWEQLLKGSGRPTIDVTPVPSAGKQKGELIPFESLQNHAPAPADVLRLPSGFHGMGELSQLLEMGKPLNGLVMSIALNGAHSSETGGNIPPGTLRGAASECVRGILQPGEFACQSAIDQFLIVSSGSQEVSQQRLTEITEKLWDFQLRADLAASMVLSWGSYEANGEALSSAIACAMQRMQENRRSRVAGAGPGRQRRAI